ncbi:c-type cytochrome [Bordetella sp. N]|uniref:c-type cytochrome n=1 Tax=Bordetella sp. N TaxID=1746199 RepID=UPI0018D22026|nr:c-type cytochrome [Bordetella sp. N]
MTNFLAAAVLRPAHASWDGRVYRTGILQQVDERSAAELGVAYRLVRRASSCAVIASSREQASEVAAALALVWDFGAPVIPAAPLGHETGQGAVTLEREYRWQSAGLTPYEDEPACATWDGALLEVRGPCLQAPSQAALRAEIASLCGVAPDQIHITHADLHADQAAYDAAVDAAVVAHALQASIAVWPDRSGGTAPLLRVEQGAAKDGAGRVAQWHTRLSQPGAPRPSAAYLDAFSTADHAGAPQAGCDALSGPQLHIAYAGEEVLHPPVAPIALNTTVDAGEVQRARLFAQETYADEMAADQDLDPVQWRLTQLPDDAGRALIEGVAAAAGWRAGPRGRVGRQLTGKALKGQGMACAQVADASHAPPTRAWAAWVVDVSVDPATGQVSLDRLTVGHHVDELVIVDGDDAMWGQRLTRTARDLLTDGSRHDDWRSPSAREQGRAETGSGLPAVGASSSVERKQSLPVLPGRLSDSDALTLPAAAAIANAIFDATGIRLREAPLTLGALTAVALPGTPSSAGLQQDEAGTHRGWRRTARKWRGSLSIAGGLVALAAAVIPWRPAIPLAQPDLSVYSSAAIERGRLIAAASDCVTCHTAPEGQRNAGGRAMDTPFGTVYTTNITPDRETGLGGWSFAAFDRAMREGVGRDGRHLYPAFPYTSFAKFSDGDMQALYAYLMTQPAVKAKPPETRLAFPYGVRPLMRYWNLLFHDAEPYRADLSQSALWNRGAYLVQGPGHCMACHSPRNAFGAEQNDASNFLAGGEVDGWNAPALNGTAATALPWTRQDLFAYLRTGFSQRHGVAAGPMAPVVENLRELPDRDIEAMAVYLESITRKGSPAAQAQGGLPPTTEHALIDIAAPVEAAKPSIAAEGASLPARILSLAGQNVYEGACAACHDTARGSPLFGVRPVLSLNTNITAAEPDNLIKVVLAGIVEPAHSGLGYMPGFADTLSDGQVADLLEYLRGQYAPQSPAWTGLNEAVARNRAELTRHAEAMK